MNAFQILLWVYNIIKIYKLTNNNEYTKIKYEVNV